MSPIYGRQPTAAFSLAACLLASLIWCSAASAQNSRLTVKAVGAGTLSSNIASTALVGAGVSVAATDLLQFFGEATFEPWHAYPADTLPPPSARPSDGVPFVVVILNTPLVGIRSRINATYFGGLRLTTPADRTVQTFVDVGVGLSRFKGTETSFLDGLPTGYYSENVSVWGAGAGFSKTLRERWVIDGEYRWCHPWAVFGGSPFHRVQLGLGMALGH